MVSGAIVGLQEIVRVGIFGEMNWVPGHPFIFGIKRGMEELLELFMMPTEALTYNIQAIDLKTGDIEDVMKFDVSLNHSPEFEFGKYGFVFPYLVVENSYTQDTHESLIEFKIINVKTKESKLRTTNNIPDDTIKWSNVWLVNLGYFKDTIFVHDKDNDHLYRLPIEGQRDVEVFRDFHSSWFRLCKSKLYGYNLEKGDLVRYNSETLAIEGKLSLLPLDRGSSYIEMIEHKNRIVLAVYSSKKKSTKWSQAQLYLTDKKLRKVYHTASLDGMLSNKDSDFIKLKDRPLIGLAGCQRIGKGRNCLVLFGVVSSKIHIFNKRWDMKVGFPLSQLIGYPVGTLFFEECPTHEHQFHWCSLKF